MSYSIKHLPASKQFVLPLNDGSFAKIDYVLKEETLYLIHSEVPSSKRGQGIGKILVEKTFDYIIEHDLKAKAICSYIKSVRDSSEKWQRTIG